VLLESVRDELSAPKTVTVIDLTGMPRTFRADVFDVDENGYLILREGGTVVARFSPAAWHGVYGAEAVTA
jgi:hypothetical protein